MEGQVPKEKKPVGLIVTVIILSLAVAGLGAFITVMLLTQNSGSGSSNSGTTAIETKPEDKPEDKPEEKDNTNIVKPSAENGNIGDHVRGNSKSKVLVVEYADPQCPGCAQMMPIMNEVYKKYKDDVAFVYRHYPLSYHVNGKNSAIAVEAAGKQGYFWEMLTTVFSNQSAWQSLSGTSLVNKFVDLFKTASNNKGDVDKFKDALSDSDITKKIDFDSALGKEAQIGATPTIMINGKDIDFTSSYTKSTIDLIEEAIDTEIARQGVKL